MANLGHNPHAAFMPDFGLPELAPQWQVLINSGLTEDQAITALSNLWTSTNDKEKAEWDAHQAELACAQQEEDHIKHENADCLLQEEEEARELNVYAIVTICISWLP